MIVLYSIRKGIEAYRLGIDWNVVPDATCMEFRKTMIKTNDFNEIS